MSVRAALQKAKVLLKKGRATEALALVDNALKALQASDAK